jgi:hypothetical protein
MANKCDCLRCVVEVEFCAFVDRQSKATAAMFAQRERPVLTGESNRMICSEYIEILSQQPRSLYSEYRWSSLCNRASGGRGLTITRADACTATTPPCRSTAATRVTRIVSRPLQDSEAYCMRLTRVFTTSKTRKSGDQSHHTSLPKSTATLIVGHPSP